MPTSSELVSIGFTDVGTDLNPNLLDNQTEQEEIVAWVRNVREHGLHVFAAIDSNSSAKQLVALTFAMGFDYVEFDEFLSSNSMSEFQFQAFVNEIIQQYPLPILITESSEWAFESAIVYGKQYLNHISVALDDYQDLSMFEKVHRNGEISGVDVAVWIIFIPDPPRVWNAYNNFESWMLQALTFDLSVYLYAITSEGAWMNNWPILRDLLEMRQRSLVIFATERVMFTVLMSLVSWTTYKFVRLKVKAVLDC